MSPNQREYPRVPVDYPAVLRVPGTNIEATVRIKDLSDTGVRFVTDKPVEAGAEVSLRIELRSEHAPPLMVTGSVVRSDPAPDEDGYAVACAFE